MSDYAVKYTNPRGVVTLLHDPAAGVRLTGPIGESMMPPVVHDTADVVDQPGELLLGSKFATRGLTFPIALIAEDLRTFRERSRAIVGRLNPLLGPGKLAIDLEGSGRQISAVYDGGLEGDIESTYWGTAWYETVLKMRCLDPYFEDEEPTVLRFGTSGEEGIDFFPMFTDENDVGPHFGSSAVFEQINVTNTGDGIAWPVWRIFGPASSPRFINASSGEALDLSADGGLVIGGGEFVTIDTRPDSPDPKSIVGFDGTRRFTHNADSSSLWGLGVGNNVISLQVDGANEQTRVELTLAQRYLSQ